MFLGRFVHTIDDKGRVSIPAGFRTELDKMGKKPPILTHLPNCLALYPMNDFTAMDKRLRDASPIHPEVRALQRFLMAGATPCPIDRSGRILVPPHLREHASLEKEVTVAGLGPHIELWNKARFDEELRSTRERFDEISSIVAQLN